jgi:hypothetical protein
MKLRQAEREKLKQLVTDSILNRLTTEETLDYIERSLKVRFTPRYIQIVKKWLREDMRIEFSQLRADKYAYIHEYQNRINELKDLQRYGRITLGQTHDEHVRIKCITELHSLSLSLANLYDLLPAITERSFANGERYAPSQEMVSTNDPTPEVTITAASTPRSEDTEII